MTVNIVPNTKASNILPMIVLKLSGKFKSPRNDNADKVPTIKKTEHTNVFVTILVIVLIDSLLKLIVILSSY